MKAVVFTLGCKVNQCESAALMYGLRQRGYDVTDKLSYADLYIINTCAVTAEAEKKSRQTIARVEKYNPNAKIVVVGCAAEASPESFACKNNVFLVSGTKNKDTILDLLDKKGIYIDCEEIYYSKYLQAGSTRTRSYIKVQDGCNNFCTYCLVPYLRGKSRSRDIESIKKEIEFLQPIETVVTGINLSDYNYNGAKLPDLLLCLKDYDTRIRLGSLEVGVIDETFLNATKQLKDFAPHFHLSLQSGSRDVLLQMGRKYSPLMFEEKVDLIRKYYPNAGITTDIIVGFSTENKRDFDDTISLCSRVGFSDIHCFAYSPRKGTSGALLPEVPALEKKQRLDALMDVKNISKKSFIQSNFGKVYEIITEEKDGEYMTGYTGNYIRVYVKDVDVNQKVNVVLGKQYKDGAFGTVVK